MVIRLFLQQWTFQNFTYRVHNRYVKWVPVLFSNNKITTNCYRDFVKISQHNMYKLWKYQIRTVHFQSLTVKLKIYVPRVGLVIVIFGSYSTTVKFKVWIGPEVRWKNHAQTFKSDNFEAMNFPVEFKFWALSRNSQNVSNPFSK